MDKERVVEETAVHVRGVLSGEGSGHDWWHTYRVWKNALAINSRERADEFTIQLAALLHDVEDWKFHGGDGSIGVRKARQWLDSLNVASNIVDHVCEIIGSMSFKGAGVLDSMRTVEGKVVQDADRLDAIGAIGIARTFAYGGHVGREIHNPNIPPKLSVSASDYLTNRGTSINHFYEKLLLLRDRLNTDGAKEIARKRHLFMETYLREFFLEWDGKE